jgi:hypothetical protein
MSDDAEDTKKLLEGVFERTKNEPEDWGAMAWTLQRAAEVLMDAHAQTWGDPEGPPERPENEQLDSPASMLYGCAMENMIKGYLIKKHGGFEQARAACPDAWQKHRLVDLARATGLPLTPVQRLLLGSLEAFVVWAGRYPISMKKQHYTIPKQYMSGENMTPTEIQRDGIKILEPFYKQLEDVVFAELRKWGQDLEIPAKT